MFEAWQQLSLYESKDLVSGFYEGYHGGDITADKAKEIKSHLAQEREFFSNASQTSSQTASYGLFCLSPKVYLVSRMSVT